MSREVQENPAIDNLRKPPVSRTLGLLILLSMCAVLPFVSSLGHELVSDDFLLISKNPHVQDPSRFLEIFGKGDGIPEPRALRTLSFVLDHRLGGDDPAAYHLTNVVLHLFVSLLLYRVAGQMGLPREGAFFAACLFAVHPGFSETVHFVTARKDSLATLFILAGFSAFLSRRGRPRLRGALVVVSILGALLSKEVAVVAPLLLFLFDLRFSGASEGDIVRPRASLGEGWGEVLRLRWRLYGGMAAIGSIVAALALTSHRISARLVEGGEGWYGNFAEHGRLAIAVWGKYLSLLVAPLRLSADYSYGAFEPPTDWFDPGVLGGIALLAAAGTGAMWLMRRGRLEGYGLLWMLVALLPVGQILPHHEILSEHNLYLPGVGFCLAVGGLFVRFRGGWGRRFAPLVAGAWVVGFASLTSVRGADWKDMESLTESVLRIHPRCVRALYNRGELHLLAGRSDQALESFQRAAQVARHAPPGFDRVLPDALNQIGLLEYGAWRENPRSESGVHLGRALAAFGEAIEGRPGGLNAHRLNYANVALAAGRDRQVVSILEGPVLETLAKDEAWSPLECRGVFLFCLAAERTAETDGQSSSITKGVLRGWAGLRRELSAGDRVAREAGLPGSSLLLERMAVSLHRAGELEAVYALTARGWISNCGSKERLRRGLRERWADCHKGGGRVDRGVGASGLELSSLSEGSRSPAGTQRTLDGIRGTVLLALRAGREGDDERFSRGLAKAVRGLGVGFCFGDRRTGGAPGEETLPRVEPGVGSSGE